MSREVIVAEPTYCELLGWKLTKLSVVMSCGHWFVKTLMGGKPDVHSGDVIECEECGGLQ